MKNIPSNIYQTLLKESLWLYLGIAGFTSVVLFDAWLIGILGTQELVAVGFVGPILIGCLNLLLALGTGITSTLAPLVGKKSEIPAGMFLWIGMLAGALLGAILWISFRHLLGWMNAPEELITMLAPYLNAFCIGLPIMGLLTAQVSLLRAASRMKETAFALLTLCIVNAVLDPILMFTAGWDLAGAAWATTIASVSAVCVAAWRGGKMNMRVAEWNRALLTILAKVALPAAGLRLMLPLGTIFILRWIGEIDTAFVGAYGVGQRIDLFIMMAPLALSSVAAPRIGQAWGRNDHPEQRSWLRAAERLGAVYGLAAAGILVLLARPFATMWSSDPAFQQDLIFYLQIMSIAFVGQAVFQINQNGFYAIQRPTLAVLWSFIQWGIWLGIAAISWLLEGGLFWLLASWPISLWIAAVGSRTGTARPGGVDSV